MNKLKIVLLSITVIFLFGSCAPLEWLRGATLGKENSRDKKIADDRMKQVVDAINNKEKQTLKVLFSKIALAEAEDFDGRTDYIFALVQGEIISWEQIGTPGGFEENNYGHVKRKTTSSFYVNTDKERYLVWLIDYPVDTDHPDNVGLYMLLVIKAEDESKLCEADKEISCAGIYKLEE